MPVHYPQLRDDLHDIGAVLSPSEAQGTLIGLWLGKGHASESEWLSELSDEASPNIMPASLKAIYTEVIDQITSADNLGLSLIFPEDEQPFRDRLMALIEFAQSVLYGYAVGKGPDPAQLSPEAKEVFEDLQAIAALDDEVDNTHDDEEDEINLHEIINYLSAALIVMYINIHPPVPSGGTASRPH